MLKEFKMGRYKRHWQDRFRSNEFFSITPSQDINSDDPPRTGYQLGDGLE